MLEKSVMLRGCGLGAELFGGADGVVRGGEVEHCSALGKALAMGFGIRECSSLGVLHQLQNWLSSHCTR